MASSTYTFTSVVTAADGASARWSQPFTVTGQSTITRVGATTSQRVYPAGTTTRIQAAQAYDGFIGAPRHLAMSVEKLYFTPSSFQTAVQGDTQALADAGIKIIASIKPAYPTSATDLAALNTMLAAWKNYVSPAGTPNAGLGINAEVILWQEPIFNSSPWSNNAAQYISYVQYYGPTVRQYFPLVYNPNNNSNTISYVQAFYPGDALIDKVMVDMYTPSFAQGITYDNAAALANNASPKKPFGIAEWGISTGNITDFGRFANYIKSFMQTRASQGLPNADVLYYNGNGPNPGPGPDTIMSSTDPKVPGIQLVYDALNQW
jgi:hypothetical protein